MREFLKGLELDAETIDTIMAEHGKLMTRNKERGDELAKQVTERDKQLEALKVVDAAGLQAKIAELEAANKESAKTHAAELAKRDRLAETEKFMAGYKFVNDATREYYGGKIEAALGEEANKNKSRKDIFDAMTTGEDGKPMPNIFAAEGTPPPYAANTGSAQLIGGMGVSTMNLNLNKHRITN